jgi:hypothetical protein
MTKRSLGLILISVYGGYPHNLKATWSHQWGAYE